MWSEPVTFGGGMTIENGGAPGFAPAPGLEGAGLLPKRCDPRLDRRRVVGLVEHGV